MSSPVISKNLAWKSQYVIYIKVTSLPTCLDGDSVSLLFDGNRKGGISIFDVVILEISCPKNIPRNINFSFSCSGRACRDKIKLHRHYLHLLRFFESYMLGKWFKILTSIASFFEMVLQARHQGKLFTNPATFSLLSTCEVRTDIPRPGPDSISPTAQCCQCSLNWELLFLPTAGFLTTPYLVATLIVGGHLCFFCALDLHCCF